MARLLGAHSQIFLGIERYNKLSRKPDVFTHDLFKEERFFRIQPGDTHYTDLGSFDNYYIENRSKYATTTYVGDKIPELYMGFDTILQNFPSSKIVFVFRNIFDVAASYKRKFSSEDGRWQRDVKIAIRDWRQAIHQYSCYKDKLSIMPILYESFFYHEAGLDELSAFLQIDANETADIATSTIFRKKRRLEKARSRDLPIDDVLKICTTAPFGQFRRIVQECTDLYIERPQLTPHHGNFTNKMEELEKKRR